MKPWILVAPALLLAACQAPSLHQTQPPLEGTEWRVQSIGGNAVDSDVRTTLMFTEDRVMGTTGCNQYTAPVELDRSSINISNAVATRRACPEPAMQQETRFLRALESARLYDHSGNALRLYDEQGNALLELGPDRGDE